MDERVWPSGGSGVLLRANLKTSVGAPIDAVIQRFTSTEAISSLGLFHPQQAGRQHESGKSGRMISTA
jgi:hypothetical protein